MLTIFTPTFNRATKLRRVYENLLSQSDENFEWLIVDDGSTDDTNVIVKEFSTNKFPIRYYKKENGGKHTAYNCALKLANGEFILCVDSDDWLSENAVRMISQTLSKENANILMSYKSDQNGKLLSNPFPTSVNRAGILELSHFYQCTGEFSLIFRTEYARNFPFPVFKGERFITESVVYDRMFVSEKAVLLPEVITVCEYQNDGLTNNLNEIMKKNPAGYCLYFMQRIDVEYDIRKRISAIGKYHCFYIMSKENKIRYGGKHKILVHLFSPLGWIVYYYYKWVRGF